MSWRFALFLGGIAGVTVYVVCYVMTHYLGELPVPLYVPALISACICTILQKYQPPSPRQTPARRLVWKKSS